MQGGRQLQSQVPDLWSKHRLATRPPRVFLRLAIVQPQYGGMTYTDDDFGDSLDDKRVRQRSPAYRKTVV